MAGIKLEAGSTFAEKYRIISPLSEGGMGALYVVENIYLTKTLALKLMHPNLAEDETLRRRFLAEARMASRIKNGHIVDVQDVGIDGPTNIPWMAMELLEGEDLKKRMRRGLPPLEEAITILKQVFSALAAAHAIPVVHRDLKPANIFLAKPNVGDAAFVVKVLDFGIAKEVTEAASTTNEAMGTPLWMAPEQTVPRSEIMPTADVWSLGLLVFHVLTGKLFWKSANNPSAAAGELMRQVLIDPIPPASERALEFGITGKLPPGFDAWFSRCVDRDPRNRFGNAALAWSVLELVLEGSDEKSIDMLAESSPWLKSSSTGSEANQMARELRALHAEARAEVSADVVGGTLVAPSSRRQPQAHSTTSSGGRRSQSQQTPAGLHSSQPSFAGRTGMPTGYLQQTPSGRISHTQQSNSEQYGISQQGHMLSGQMSDASIESQISSTGINPGVVQVLGRSQAPFAPPQKGNNLALVLAAAAFGAVIVMGIVVFKGPATAGNGRVQDTTTEDPQMGNGGQGTVGPGPSTNATNTNSSTTPIPVNTGAVSSTTTSVSTRPVSTVPSTRPSAKHPITSPTSTQKPPDILK